MSISYHGVIGHTQKSTLPSVDSWGTNKNIIKDPPRSYHTRRRDKVNEGGELNEMYYDSGDRFAENITVYARGVNPSVSVEYGNSGLSSGANSGLSVNAGVVSGGSAKLPYRIMNYGAFRAPILAQEQLLPLSRLPRNVTMAKTNIQTLDYSKTISCAREKTDFRQINPEIIHVETTPTIYKQIARPVKEHFEVNYVIEDPVHYGVVSKISNIIAHPMKEYSEDKYVLEDPLHYGVASKVSSTLHHQPTEVITPAKYSDAEVLKYTRQTNKSGINNVEFIHKEIELERNMPLGQMHTNNSSSRVSVDVGSRNFNRVLPSMNRGGFDGAGTKPQLERPDISVSTVSNQGLNVKKAAALQMQERRN